jgi:flavorubredoxin
MADNYKAVRIGEGVWWVGAIDWALTDFHGYSTQRGTTYNAYLIIDDKITLVDTVRAPFVEEMLERIASVCPPGDIDYVISNHSEMDHSGSLPRAVEVIKPEKLFASVMGQKALADHFGGTLDVTAVKDGETLSLGRRQLHFMETRMLHWPDSMISYLTPDKVLFSQDGFGMHLASSARFADEIETSVLEYEAKKYFANILLPFAPLVTRLLEQVKSAGLEISILAPDHGPVWRKDIGTIPGLYAKWAAQRPSAKVVIPFGTMWHSTEKMARAISEGVASEHVEVNVMPLSGRSRSDVMTELLGAGALVVGTPTMNNQMFPTVADFLTYAKGLKPRNLVAASFGSFGWSGEGAKIVRKELIEMKLDVVGDPLECRYVPKSEELARCRELGVTIAKRVKERAVLTDVAPA